MHKTTISWLLLYFSGLGGALFKVPILGLLTYIFTFYTLFIWGKEIRAHSWSMYSLAVFLLAYIIHKSAQEKLSWQKMPQLKWLLLAFVNLLALTPFADWPEEHYVVLTQFTNIIIIYYLTIKIITNKLYYKLVIWLQIWGIWFFGWTGTWYGKTVGGRLEGIGGPGTHDSNQLAAHMLTGLPLAGICFQFGSKWEKIGIFCASPFILNGIIMCRSRGAFLSIAIMVVLWIIFSPPKQRIKSLFVFILGGLLFVQLTDPGFWARMTTISEYANDGSSMGRLASWQGAFHMVQDHPFGTGGGGWLWNSPQYSPEVVANYDGELRAVHNTYLLVATDWGLQGFAIFLIFLLSTLLELYKIRRRKVVNNDTFYREQATALMIAIIGFLCASLFINRCYAEVLYIYCAMATSLSNLQQSALLDTAGQNAGQK